MKKLFKTVLMLFATMLIASDETLLIDVSGSIIKSKLENKVRDVVKHYIKNNSKNILAFSDNVYKITSANQLVFGGRTNLSLALKKVSTKFVIIITDGIPNDQQATKQAATVLKNKGIKICSVYVSSGTTIPVILKEISHATFLTTQLDQSLNLCSGKVKEELTGIMAVKKSVDENLYDLF